MLLFVFDKQSKMSLSSETKTQVPKPTVSVDFDDDDWENADLSLPTEVINQEFSADPIEVETKPKEEFNCSVCKKTFADKNSLKNHLKACNEQENAFNREFKGKAVFKSKDLKDRLKRHHPKELDKIWEWVNYVVNLPALQEYGTGESFGIQDRHSELSHFIIWAVSQLLLGNNIISTASSKVDTAMESLKPSGWEIQAATNKVVPFLNDLVKKKKGRDIEPIITAYYMGLSSVAFTPSPLEKKQATPKEEIERQKAEEQEKLELGRTILSKGFRFNLTTLPSKQFLEKYIKLADLIKVQEETFGLEPLHVTAAREDMVKMKRKIYSATGSSGSDFVGPPYPEFSFTEKELDRAIISIGQITDFMLLFKNDTFKSGKDGLDAFYNKGIAIDGCVLFPFNEVIENWLEDKKIPAKVLETMRVKCNRLKNGPSLLHAMKMMKQLEFFSK